MNQNKEYYISRLGKLFLKLDNKTQKLITSRLEKYCEVIYIDEFQDYNGYDFKVIKYLFEKTKIKIIAVGDINQSCLVPLRGRGNRIAKQTFDTIKSIDEFKKNCQLKFITMKLHSLEAEEFHKIRVNLFLTN